MLLKMGSSNFLDVGNNLNEIVEDVINNSDYEEGEINDESDLDEISDVSTEEEELLRQRIMMLENYNLALGKKEARLRRSERDNKEIKCAHSKIKQNRSPSLSDLIVIDDVDNETLYHDFKKQKTKGPKKHKKPHRKYKVANKNGSKKISRNTKSSSDTDTENNKRKQEILREAVGVSKRNLDKSSLKQRLLHFTKFMQSELIQKKPIHVEEVVRSVTYPESAPNTTVDGGTKIDPRVEGNCTNSAETLKDNTVLEVDPNATSAAAPICTFLIDQYPKVLSNESILDKVNANMCTSDDEAEALRQLALNSKSLRKTVVAPDSGKCKSDVERKLPKPQREESEDSDTAELRMIALKSAMLKKAMDRKKKEKGSKKKIKRKRKSCSNMFSDDEFRSLPYSNGDTDVETIDMDIDTEQCGTSIIETAFQNAYGISDIQTADYYQMNSDPSRIQSSPGQPQDQNDQNLFNECQYYDSNNYMLKPRKKSDLYHVDTHPDKVESNVEEEDDEDALRAQLLSSIIRNNSNASHKVVETSPPSVRIVQPSNQVSGELSDSGLIIKLGESDSGSECEQTKNLTKMHKKLTQNSEFQKNLDHYLKFARSKFDKPDVEKSEVSPEKKHTPMAVKHLPKADQQEYRQLVKRMSELEKMRSARQQATKAPGTEQGTLKAAVVQHTSADPIPLKQVVSGANLKIVAPPSMHKSNTMLAGRSLQVIRSVSSPSGLDIQLDLSRKRITSQMKVVEQLQTEGEGLRKKTETLAQQLQIITASLRASRLALNSNQKTLQTAHRNLLRLRKQHHTFMNRMKLTNKSDVPILSVTIQQEINKKKSDVSKPIPDPNQTFNNKPNIARKIERPLQPTAKLKVAKSAELQGNDTINQKAVIVNGNHTHTPEGEPLKAAKSDPICNNNNHEKPNEQSETLPVVNISDTSLSLFQITVTVDNSKNSCEENKTELKVTDETTIHNLPIQYDERKSLVSTDDVTYSHSKIDETTQNIKSSSNHLPRTSQDTMHSLISSDIVPCQDMNGVDLVTEKQNSSHVSSNDIISTKENRDADNILLDVHTSVGTSDSASNVLIHSSKPFKPTESATVPEHSINNKCIVDEELKVMNMEYVSPLQGLRTENNWTEDIQAILCPFVIGGNCLDTKCKYFHPRT